MQPDLRVVRNDDPPADHDEGGGGDDGAVLIEVQIHGADERMYASRAFVLEEDADPETIAQLLVNLTRSAACAYDPEVHLALEHRLLGWGKHD